MASCKLCLKNKTIKKSHIIPNSFFKFIKQDSGKNNGKYIRISKDNTNWDQGSFYEFMLCGDCESKFSANFEEYVADIFIRNPKVKGVKVSKTDTYVKFSNLDYKKIKLFQLSLLWRASISNNDFYKYVNLSKSKEEVLRNILYNLTTVPSNFYPCTFERLLSDIGIEIANKRDIASSKKLIINPKTTETPIASFITFVLGGFSIRMYLSIEPICSLPAERILNETGELKCFQVKIDDHELLMLGKKQLLMNKENGVCSLTSEA